MRTNDPIIVKQVLDTAQTYLDNTQHLIYSYAGKVFLGEGTLFDPDYNGRGNIDCSTYVHLVLQGIAFENSPYQTGEAKMVPNTDAEWRQSILLDRIKKDKNNRRAGNIAKYYWEKGQCFTDPDQALPGDLVFYRAPDEVAHFYTAHGVFHEICHVGIVAEDGVSMYNSTGLPDKKEQEAEKMDAIQMTPLVSDREPYCFARLQFSE